MFPETAVVEAPSNDLETGLIAGVVIGVVVVSACTIIVVLIKKRKSQYMAVPPKDPEDTTANGIKLNNMVKGMCIYIKSF